MSFFKKHPVITALILAAILIFAITITAGRKNMTYVESGVGDVTSVPASGFSRFTGGVGAWFRTAFGVSDLQKETAKLREENARLNAELVGKREQELENERLKTMLKLVESKTDTSYIAARVIGKTPGYWFSQFSINQGRKQGLKVGDVVVNAEGALVGRISEVGGNWSKVESIIDADSNISAIIERTRDDVMVRGVATVSGDDSQRLCEIYTLPLDNDLQPGDVIVTSGLGSMGGTDMPKGIPIGKVVSVDISSASIERTALLAPDAGFTTLEEVLVIVENSSLLEVGISPSPLPTFEPEADRGSLGADPAATDAASGSVATTATPAPTGAAIVVESQDDSDGALTAVTDAGLATTDNVTATAQAVATAAPPSAALAVETDASDIDPSELQFE